jgi:hypothetical protein
MYPTDPVKIPKSTEMTRDHPKNRKPEDVFVKCNFLEKKNIL